MRRHRISGRDFAVALSAANLLYLASWSKCLVYDAADTYLMKLPPAPERIAAVCLDVALAAFLLWLALTWARRLGGGDLPQAAQRLFLIFLLLPLNAIRSELAGSYPLLKLNSPLLYPGRLGGALVISALGSLSLAALLVFPRQACRAAFAVLLIFFPFVGATFGWGAVEMYRYNPAGFGDKPLARRLEAGGGRPRVLWIIFDEMDQRLAFVERNPALQLPALDCFRSVSFHAENAASPTMDTLTSLPALITGNLVRTAQPAGPSELLVGFAGSGRPVPWSALPNVFSEARSLGFNSGIVGWYHPYCRVLNGSLTDCWWWEFENQDSSAGSGLGRLMLHQTQRLFETSLLSPFGQSLTVRMRAWTYSDMLPRALQAAADPALGLVLLHFPVPHAPHPYDRATGRLTLANAPIRGYLDSLALADRTLARLRGAMERDGTWDRTTVLISADHPFRTSQLLDGKSDRRVPFLLKLAGQHSGMAFDPAFNTVLTHDLLLAILRREITDPEELGNWMRQRTRQPLAVQFRCSTH